MTLKRVKRKSVWYIEVKLEKKKSVVNFLGNVL